ncbi:MAG: MFS transporter [Chloroflexi bacterium]|nr:MFS transporter [Chloroflexota bacterium]
MGIKNLFGKDMVRLWTRDLMVTAIAIFLMRFGEGMLGGARMNFFVNTLGLSDGQVLSLEGIREIPGLILILLAALTMRMPLSYRAATSALILGAGYMLQATVHSYAGLIAVALAASFGLHLFQPVSPALGLALATDRTRGRVLGLLASVGSLAGIVGVGALTLTSNLVRDMSLRWYYVIGGALIIVSALVFWRLSPTLGATELAQPRIVLKKRYWRYYLLTFFEGSRKEILGSFCTLVLVNYFGWQIWQTSGLLMGASVLSFVLAPYLGALVDRYGSKNALIVGYSICCLGAVVYATVPNAGILAGAYIVLRLALILNLGLSVYAHEEAPAEELNPTLAAGVSVNHISSVAMPFIFSAMLPVIGYTGVYWFAAAIILISIAFVARMLPSSVRKPVPSPAAAD